MQYSTCKAGELYRVRRAFRAFGSEKGFHLVQHDQILLMLECEPDKKVKFWNITRGEKEWAFWGDFAYHCVEEINETFT